MKIQKVKQNQKNANKSKKHYIQVESDFSGAPKGIRIPVSSSQLLNLLYWFTYYEKINRGNNQRQ
jgi:hypothetical protein